MKIELLILTALIWPIISCESRPLSPDDRAELSCHALTQLRFPANAPLELRKLYRAMHERCVNWYLWSGSSDGIEEGVAQLVAFNNNQS